MTPCGYGTDALTHHLAFSLQAATGRVDNPNVQLSTEVWVQLRGEQLYLRKEL